MLNNSMIIIEINFFTKTEKHFEQLIKVLLLEFEDDSKGMIEKFRHLSN